MDAGRKQDKPAVRTSARRGICPARSMRIPSKGSCRCLVKGLGLEGLRFMVLGIEVRVYGYTPCPKGSQHQD